MEIIEIAKSLNSGPVIKKNGIKENKKIGTLQKINFSLTELKSIKKLII